MNLRKIAGFAFAMSLLAPVGLMLGTGSATAAAAHGQTCTASTGSATISPGLSTVPANQTITATGTMSKCTPATATGGTGTLHATVKLKNGSCQGLAKGTTLPLVGSIKWKNGKTSAVNITAKTTSNAPTVATFTGKATSGLFKGQAVMDSYGLLGQTMHVGPWSAEVILITDPEHAVPVEIERTGVRTIAVGTGDTQSLALPYLPANADVKPGDLLVTSGLGGVFPQGYPVARVTEVHHDAVQPLAQIRARPLAQLDKLHEVMLVWFRADHPAAPSGTASGDTVDRDLATGNVAFQPQPVPASPASAPRSAKPAPRARPPGGPEPRGAKPRDTGPRDTGPRDTGPPAPPGATSRTAAPEVPE